MTKIRKFLSALTERQHRQNIMNELKDITRKNMRIISSDLQEHRHFFDTLNLISEAPHSLKYYKTEYETMFLGSNPSFKGKLCINNTTTLWSFMGDVHDEMTENVGIAILPKPFNESCTPYNAYNFNYETKKKANSGCGDPNINNVFKVIVVGDVSVGKTCIVNRFCHQLFDGNYKATIGVDFEVETINVLGVPTTLHIWDTAGQEKFKCIAQSYYRGAHAIIVTFDFSSLNTLSHCERWLKEALDSNLAQKSLLFLVGNKLDLLSPAAYKNTEEIAMKTAKMLSAEYWPVSAKTGVNVDLMFERMTALLFDTYFAKEDKFLEETLKIGSNLKSGKKSLKNKTQACSCYR